MANLARSPIVIDRWINRCWQRLRFGQFLTKVADWVAVYLVVFGTAVLVVKLVWPQLWPNVLWLAVGVLPVAGIAWWLSRRDSFSRTESIAVLDQRLRAGGLLMTLSESPDDAWQAHLPQFERLWQSSLPQFWPVRFVKQVSVPVAFVVAVSLLPPRVIEASSPLSHTAGQQAGSQLEELLGDIQEAALLREDEQRQLNDEIGKLNEEAGNAPLTHEKWETVDALRAKMLGRVSESSARMMQAKHAVAAMMEALAGQALDQLTAEQRDRLEQEVVETLQKLSKNGGLGKASKELQEKLKRLAKDGQLPEDEAEQQELMNDLKEFLDQEADKLEELRKKCKKCEGQGEGEGQNKDGDDEEKDGNKPGKGGTSRGRGDAELTWGDESKFDGKFKETVLPPGSADKLREEVIGQSGATPEVKVAETAPRSASREATVATGNETWNRNVRPRHRTVLKKYFDEKAK